MWLATTSAVKNIQSGYFLYRHARDDLNLIIDGLADYQLSSEDSGQVVVKHIKKAFAKYPGRRMPKAFDNLACYDGTSRKRDESSVNSIACERVLLS
eukprot:1555074-Pyramimonas_sp.AAC.1